MNMRTIEWKNNKVRIINQSKLPLKLEFLELGNLGQLWKAIKSLQVRGAPALGAAAALGVYLGIKDSKADSFKEFNLHLKRVIRYLGTCRPTARNLFWGMERVLKVVSTAQDKPVSYLKKLILQEAKRIIEEDCVACRKIGDFGEKLLKNGSSVLTICNAGALATIDYGTALGVIYRAEEKGKKIKVFASETRPLLQGARLTCWELDNRRVDVTLICDNTAAKLIADKKIDLIITGADRISANGDAANKIGTFNLAILAKYHKIPFYIAAPISTFDKKISSGRFIDIEMRPADEVRTILGKKFIALANAKVLNPAFDLTAASLISAIITERGIIRPVNKKNIRKILEK
jgi:methylthioribose-1-phosphate isomerase